MTARRSEALNLCQAILDNDKGTVDVYWKLSSVQYQSGQQSQANKTLAKALRLYPGNAKLETLRDIISSDSTEQQRIASAVQLNQGSIDKGAMKITCLTKTGEIAITACKRRLELTSVDGNRMRTRLAALEEAQISSRIAIALANDSRQSKPVAVAPPVAKAPIKKQPTKEELALQARRAAYKSLVSDVQIRLNNLGFSAGLPDGVPGNKTRSALTDFYTATDAPAISSIDNQTLEHLSAAETQLKNAQRIMKESQLALAEGNAQAAEQKLNKAKDTSGLLAVPPSLERSIQVGLAATQKPATTIAETTAEDNTAQVTDQTPSPTTVARTTPTTPAPGFDDLMVQIQTLQGQILRKQSDQAEQLNELRSTR